MAEFKDRLKELRLECDYSMGDVVVEVNKRFGSNLTTSHISRYENGERTPSITIASYLAQFYGVSLDYLVGLVNDRTEKLGDPSTWKHERIIVKKKGDEYKVEVKKK